MVELFVQDTLYSTDSNEYTIGTSQQQLGINQLRVEFDVSSTEYYSQDSISSTVIKQDTMEA